MANTKSAKKRIRRDEKARMRNKYHRSKARNAVKKARLLIDSGQTDEAGEAVRTAVSALDHAASKGVIHANNASRRKSRLMAQLAAMEPAPQEEPAPKAKKTTRKKK